MKKVRRKVGVLRKTLPLALSIAMGICGPGAAYAEEVSVTAPAESQMDTAVSAPAESQMDTAVSAPAESQADTAVSAPAESQMDTALPAPAESQVGTTASAPAETQLDAPASAPSEGQSVSADITGNTSTDIPADTDDDSSAESAPGDSSAEAATGDSSAETATGDESSSEASSEDEYEIVENLEGQTEADVPSESFIIDDSTVDSTETEQDGIIMEASADLYAAGDGTSDSGTTVDGHSWTLQDGVLTVSGNGPMHDYEIIYYWGGGTEYKDVPPWYSLRDHIREVVVSPGVTSIGNFAFRDCTYLKKLTLPEGITTIGQYSFTSDSSLESITLPQSLTRLGDGCFADCYSLKEAVIPDGVTEIGDRAFANDSGITSITIGRNVTKIGGNAFYYCEVAELKLPAGLTDLDENGLNGLYSLQNYRMDGSSVYSVYDGALYKDGGKTLISFPEARTGNYTIPEGVETLAESSFIYTKLSSVSMPSTLKTIGDGAFCYGNLVSCTIPDSVTKLGERAFFNNQEMTSLVIGNGITEIPKYAFYGDVKLSSVKLPDHLTTIGSQAFKGAPAHFVLPPSVTSVGEDAFSMTGGVDVTNTGLTDTGYGSYVRGITVSLTVNERYGDAFRILDLVNQERAKAGADPLKMDTSLLETAMMRAAEGELYFSHTRPSGGSCFTANSLMSGENIAGSFDSPEDAMTAWMNSEGHKANILGKGYTSIGIGVVENNGTRCYVQCFGGTVSSEASASSYSDIQKTRNIVVENSVAEGEDITVTLKKDALTVGESTTAQVNWDGVEVGLPNLVFASSNPKVASVSGSTVTAVGKGTCSVSATFGEGLNSKEAATLTVSKARKNASGNESDSAGDYVAQTKNSGFRLNYKRIYLKSGKKTSNVKAFGIPKGDSIKSWKSSNTKVAKVKKKGATGVVITAGKKAGTAVITVVTKKKHKATLKVVVSSKKKTIRTTKLKLAGKKTRTLKAGKSLQLKVSKVPKNSTEKITYSTSSKKIATVSKNGKVKAKKKGKAIITVRSGKKKIKITIKVK